MALYSTSMSASSAQYQNTGSTMQQLERAVDQIDTPQAWRQAPVARPASYASAAPAPTGMFSRRQVMRTFLEGDASSSYSSPASAGTADATSQAYAYFQTAATQEKRAYGYGNQARYDTDSWSRNKAASTAEYAASACESAASSAYQVSQYGDAQARSYAAKAQGCANRARSAANTARWYANAGQ